MVVHVVIGVVRAGHVVERILDELEAGKTHRVERLVVGASGVGQRQRRRSEVLERREPRLEDRPDHVVALKIDAADPAAAVVQVEIRGQARVLGPERHRERVGEVRLHVGARTEEPLLLAAPERQAHGAVHLQIKRLQDTHRLQDHGAAGRVVGGAGPAVP